MYTPASPRSYWALIAAAGLSTRMGTAVPKQYLKLGDKTVLEHTLGVFDRHEQITGIVVVLSAHDHFWKSTALAFNKPLFTVTGGDERAKSVLNGLNFLENNAQPQDWVLVHDAARPCLRSSDIDKLIQVCQTLTQGGAILAMPVSDTLKEVDSHTNIIKTLNRNHLWRALTPQMFPISVLSQALSQVISRGLTVTDEAAAMEHSGQNIKIVPGNHDNIKITQQSDLGLAELFLKEQGRI